MTSLKRLKSETKILNNIVKPKMSSIIISNYEMRKESSIIFTTNLSLSTSYYSRLSSLALMFVDTIL